MNKASKSLGSSTRMTIRWATFTVLAGVVVTLTGCREMGTQRFKAFAPSHFQELAGSTRIVLDVRCTNVTARPDYSLYENLQMLAPRPKRSKIDVMLLVERVVQGEFTGTSLQVHWLREPTLEQREELGMTSHVGFSTFTNGMPLRVGFDSLSEGRLQNLRLMRRYD